MSFVLGFKLSHAFISLNKPITQLYLQKMKKIKQERKVKLDWWKEESFKKKLLNKIRKMKIHISLFNSQVKTFFNYFFMYFYSAGVSKNWKKHNKKLV